MSQELRGSTTIVFILDVPVNDLMNVFQGEGFHDVQRVGAPPSMIPPGIQIGPPRSLVGLYKNIRIEYVVDRYMLQFMGPLNEILELKQRLPSLFEQSRFNLDEMMRYCEFYILFPLSIETERSMRSKVRVSGIRRLNEICECSLRPFRLSLSNSDSPLNDRWLHITMQPDINRPHRNFIIEIIKRTPNFGGMAHFLDTIENIINEIKEFLESG